MGRPLLPRHPIAACPIVVRGGRATAHLADRVVRLDFRGAPLARLLELCDGATEYRDIRRRLARGADAARVDRLVAFLVRNGLLVDAGDLAGSAWRYVENPQRIGADPDPALETELPRRAAREARSSLARRYRWAPDFRLRALIERRRSSLAFDARPLGAQKILALLWAANGWTRGGRHRSVPSAGAIYPLTVGLLNLRSVPGLARGVYRVHFRDDGTLGLRRLRTDAGEAMRAFVNPLPLREAQGAIVVFGDFAKTGEKYGNRAALLVTLEAGHAMQSAMLAATELGVAHSEVGGFFEERLRALFGTGARLTPLSTLIFGAAPRRRDRARRAPPARFVFQWVEPSGAGYSLPFHLASVELQVAGREGPLRCWGRAVEPALAVEKARAEAFERLACVLPTDLRVARFADLGATALDPRQVVSYAPAQYRVARFPFHPFSERRDYRWKEGRELLSGRRRAVLAELVYFLSSLPRACWSNGYSSASTSGVAAYPDWAGALERAALELIERDAFMRAWLLGETGAPVRERSLPQALRSRIARLRAHGVEMHVRMLSADPAFVFMAVARSARHGFTRVAAAAGFEAAEAADHAGMEAESMAGLQLANPATPLHPSAVREPTDHGLLYAQRKFYRRADLLLRGGAERPMWRGRSPRGGLGAIEQWLRRTGRQLIWVDLSGPHLGADAPRVVRALIPGLLPISFGFATEPLGLLPGIALHAPKAGLREALLPHPFA